MRPFAGGGVRIWNLSREAKVVYTGFLLMSTLAFASSFALAEDMIGPRGTAAYYGVGSAPHAVVDGSGGPAIELPPDAAAPAAVVAMPYRKLLEVAHFHLFTVPVFLLIVTHLFMLTGLAPRTKLAWIIAAWVTALGHIVAPFVVRYGGAGLAWLFATSGLAMAVPLLVVTLYPTFVMWRSPPSNAPG